MSAVMQGAIAVALFVVVGVGGTVVALGVLKRRDEDAAGIRMLATLSWREFSRLVLDAMAHRGFLRADSDPTADDGSYRLVRGPERRTLWCKHGSAFLIGKLTINELANAMQLAGSETGVLATQGRIVEDARDTAKTRGIEVLDGPALWAEVRGILPDASWASLRNAAARRAYRRTAVVWLLSMLAAFAGHSAAGRLLSPAAPAATHEMPADVAAPAERPPGRAPGQPVDTAPPPAPATSTAIPPPQAPASSMSPADQRSAAARDIGDLPMVGRATWTSASTLRVELLTPEDDAFGHICPLIERHPDIATSRIQLNLPAGSRVPVRFRQCRTF